MLRSSILTACLTFSVTHALAESTLALAGASNGLYMSRDRGYTWEKNAALGDAAVREVALDRSDLRRLYAVTSEALLVSDDGGANWLAGEFPQPAKIQRVISGGADVVFALAAGEIWASLDGGRHWLPQGVPAVVMDLALDASVPPAIYALTPLGVYKKSGGTAWILLPGLTTASRLAADPDEPGKLWRVGDAVIEQTADGGDTWTRLPDISASTVANAVGFSWSGDFEPEIARTVLTFAPAESGGDVIALVNVCISWDGLQFPCLQIILAARNGIWRSVWKSAEGTLSTLAADRASNLVLAGGAAARGPGLYRSTLSGLNWTGVSGFERVAVNTIAIATVDSEPWSQVHIGTNQGLFSSSDRGQTWQSNTALGRTPVIEIGVDPGGSGLILASTLDGLFRSTDAGASWEKTGLCPGILAGAIVIDPKSNGRAYLVDRDTRQTNRWRLWASEDRGRNWYQVASQPEGILDVTLDPRTTPATVYVAGNFGIQKSIDAALTWTSIYRGFTRLVRVGEPAGTIYQDGGEQLWRTATGGESWQLVGPSIRTVAPSPPAPLLLWEWIELDFLAVGWGRNEGLIAASTTYFAEYAGPFTPDKTEQSLLTFDGDGWRTSSLALRKVEIDARAAGLVYAAGPGLARDLPARPPYS